MRILELIKLIRDIQKENPYPPDIFIEPTPEQYQSFNKKLKAHGLYPDAYNGAMGRRTWNNCCDKIIEKIRDWEELL